MRRYICIIFLGVWVAVASGEEFSKPRNFSEFESNLGEQKLVEVVRPWIGVTPQELAPGSIPLGSLKNKTYVPAEVIETESEPLLPVEPKEVEEVELPKEENFPFELSGEPLPVEDSAQGWVGPLPLELAPEAVALGSLANRRMVSRPPKNIQPSQDGLLDQEQVLPDGSLGDQPQLSMSIFASTRAYFTQNVLRLDGRKDTAGVWENMTGASLGTRSFEVGPYITMVPRLDLLMQVASYEDKEVRGTNIKELLGYRFGLVKAGLGMELPQDISLSLGYEYNLVSSLDTGDKMSDAFTPSLSLGTMWTLGETTLLMLDGMARYSMTDRVLPYAIPGQFADDGDNLQFGLSLMLIKVLGNEGQFMLMPSLSFTRSEYLKNENDGRVDWLTTLGVNGTWQATEWLSLDLGLSCSILRMNDKGKILQGDSSRYHSFDLGGSLMASHAF
jgi:hypothetical protein